MTPKLRTGTDRMLLQEIIIAKRDGHQLDRDQIRSVVGGLRTGDMSDAQAGAFAMAVCLKGMTVDERVALTEAMRDSGDVLSWDLPGPAVDKHSTGGIGDNVSLILAPALAACGAYVPMISGRGLGHTGGTLDKFDAIPGYQTTPDTAVFEQVVQKVGCAIIGQTANLAPADKRLYAIRDISGTVESLDLITASILSKKLAAGLDALVLDVKCGSGAFMATLAEAELLANALSSAANGAGCRTSALVTDMNEPLASAAGNGLEMANACAFLTGHEIDNRLWEVVLALGTEALTISGIAADDTIARRMMGDAFESGAAAERMAKMIAAMGGPSDFMDSWVDHLGEAAVVRDVFAPERGFVTAIDGRALGMAVVELGGGRRHPDDQINYQVGFDQLSGLGMLVDAEQPIGRVHAVDDMAATRASAALQAAYSISDVPVDGPHPVLRTVGQ